MADDAWSPSLDSGAVFEGMPAATLLQAWDGAPALIAVTLGRQHRLVYQNRASKGMFGSREIGTPLREAFPEVGEAGVAPLTRVLETGALVDVPPRQVGVRDLTGGDVVLRYVLAPLGRAGGPVEGVVITAVDVTAEARAEEAVARSRLLAELTTRLTEARDATKGLQALTDALVPVVADLAAVYVVPELPEGGDLDTAPVPPEVIAVAESLTALGPPPPPARRGEPPPWDRALRAGEPIILVVDAASMPVVAPDPATAAWLGAAGGHSIAVVPLVVAGSLTGALVLLAAGGRAAYRDADLPFLTDVAARAGAAIAQLRTHHRQRELALQLQRALLPTALPVLPGITVAARYVARAPGVEVGGDWWEVHDLGAGRVALGIGDVSGRGVAAAAVMGQARAAMRAAGHAHLPPAEVLALLDAQLSGVVAPGSLDEPAPPRFATACYAVVEPADGCLRAANAGHLPLLVRSTDGRVRVVELPSGTPLGLLVDGFKQVEVPFVPGDTLVMFTDGLVETRDEDLGRGIATFAAELERLGDEPDLDALVERLLEVMSRRHGYGHDDVALVLARRERTPDP